MLFDGDKEITSTTDPQKMADLLQAQFTSVFSDPHAPDVTDPSFPPPLEQLPQELQDIIPAISSQPVQTWEESFTSGVVPKFYV